MIGISETATIGLNEAHSALPLPIEWQKLASCARNDQEKVLIQQEKHSVLPNIGYKKPGTLRIPFTGKLQMDFFEIFTLFIVLVCKY